MIGSRIQGRTYTLPGKTSHCHELSGSERTTYEPTWPVRPVGRV